MSHIINKLPACIMVFLSLVTIPLQAQLGMRQMEKGVQAVQWEVCPEITKRGEDQQVQVSLSGKDNGWFTTTRRYSLNDQTQMMLKVTGGNVTMQFEWFTSQGRFLGATNVLEAQQLAAGQQTVSVNAMVPASIQQKVRRFRPKFWIFGNNATARIATFQITSPRAFRTEGLQLQHTWLPTSRLSPDLGMHLDCSTDVIHISKDNDKDAAGLVFEDRVDYDPTGVIMIDIQNFPVENAATPLTLQLLCWDEKGTYLPPVKLMTITSEGTFEIAPSAYGSAIPPTTQKINFKLWIWGKDAQCNINGLFWATAHTPTQPD